ncbi:MAG: SUMF1/EgtB/PvdO family nonheme iron enzyme [Treponema sp.]|nr:SUMF1/EgtB/PvdO family nonheme iron enzyme [Treponema sp.]
MQKRLSLFLVLSFIMFCLGILSCSNLIEDLRLKKKKSPKDGMIEVSQTTVTIRGADPTFIDSSASGYLKGVFIEGRNVTLNPFSIAEYEVTQELYKTIMDGQSVGDVVLASDPSRHRETGENPLASGEVQEKRPVENITWYDAVYFCNAFTEKTLTEDQKVYAISNITVNSDGHITSADVSMDRTKTGYRLPTEAEWEFAARGGNQSAPDWNYLFSGHDKAEGSASSDQQNTGMDFVGWYINNLGNGGVTNITLLRPNTPGYGTHQVGLKGANRLGIHDMSGNVWEWCWDWYDDSVGSGNVIDPTGPDSGERKVIRGRCWSDFANNGSVCYRFKQPPANNTKNIGMRVVRSLP